MSFLFKNLSLDPHWDRAATKCRVEGDTIGEGVIDADPRRRLRA